MDPGPFSCADGIIDLSRAAADGIGMIDQGMPRTHRNNSNEQH